ncbi:MAG: MBL fold metallo-hydrolase [Gammaproteobacteria bacterium]|nr:MBL fold metallo-hydrolase [Gammaproteobacteria bacterium]
MKRPLIVTALVVIALALLALLVLGSSRVQDTLLARGLEDAFARPVSEPPEGGMRVFMCGTASPLPTPDRAQACVAVQVDDRLFIVDAGAGSADVAALGGLPLERLQGLLLTHFHSDHIAAIGDFNLESLGRPACPAPAGDRPRGRRRGGGRVQPGVSTRPGLPGWRITAKRCCPPNSTCWSRAPSPPA